MHTKWLISAFIAGLLALTPALSQARDVPMMQLDALHGQLLEHPTDRKLNLDYAALAMQLGDYESAISPLERILMSEPDNAKIKLQLGTLYQSLGSELMSEYYLSEAIATRGASQEVIDKAEAMLHDR